MPECNLISFFLFSITGWASTSGRREFGEYSVYNPSKKAEATK